MADFDLGNIHVVTHVLRYLNSNGMKLNGTLEVTVGQRVLLAHVFILRRGVYVADNSLTLCLLLFRFRN
jgi:hypothetical protein